MRKTTAVRWLLQQILSLKFICSAPWRNPKYLPTQVVARLATAPTFVRCARTVPCNLSRTGRQAPIVIAVNPLVCRG